VASYQQRLQMAYSTLARTLGQMRQLEEKKAIEVERD
jgi:hypothetical protein